MKKRIGSIFIIVLLILSLTFSVSAAGTSNEPDLKLTMGQYHSWVFLNVNLQNVDATNGRVCITYDKDVMSFGGYEASGRWIADVNADNEGEVWFAWVGKQNIKSLSQLNLTFKLKDSFEGNITVSTEMTELYKNGNKIVAAKEYLVDEITIEVSYDSDSEGSYPLPETPTYPNEDEDPDGEPENPDEPDTPECPFTDIEGHWAEEDIIKAWENGLVNGVTEDTFAPETPITRGMFVTLLYRLNGEPDVTGNTPFTDVADGMYYADAVLWAYNAAVVNGTSSTTFEPDRLVTRQELVTMLYRYAELTGTDVSASTDITSFVDADKVANWAEDAMEWAVAESIIKGYDGNLLKPTNGTKRAEAATILVRFAGL